jgi:outer membrane immunogenic protein
MIRALMLGLLAAAASTSAMAADLIVEEDVAAEAMAAAHDWNGGYVGVFGGYGWGDASQLPSAGAPAEYPISGWLLGVDAGANFQTGNFVLGVEGDVAWANISGSEPCPVAIYTCSTDIDWVATLRGRAGVAADAVLLYATAGLAVASVVSDTDPFTPGAAFEATYVGWTAGAGVEVAVSDNVSLKAEYLYTDLGSQTDTDEILGGPGVDVEVPITFHAIKAGVNFAF